MPVVEDPIIAAAPDNDAVVWRFMSVEKLLSLLTTSCIHFTQLKLLLRDDPFEGQYTKAQISERARFIADDTRIDEFLLKQSALLTEETRRAAKFINSSVMLQAIANGSALQSYISCWHLNEHESAALWRIYAAIDAGIAIRTTVGRLRQAIKTPHNVLCGTVKYIDYSKETISETNVSAPLFHKRASFAHEKELRLCLRQYPADDDMSKMPPGIALPCDVSVLVDRLIVSPLSPDWFSETISAVVKKLGFNLAISKSSILETPEYPVYDGAS